MSMLIKCVYIVSRSSNILDKLTFHDVAIYVSKFIERPQFSKLLISTTTIANLYPSNYIFTVQKIN